MPLAKAGSAAPSTSGVSRRRSRPTPRQRLLDGATKLFTTEGIRVIGIDRILRALWFERCFGDCLFEAHG